MVVLPYGSRRTNSYRKERVVGARLRVIFHGEMPIVHDFASLCSPVHRQYETTRVQHGLATEMSQRLSYGSTVR